jgi:hypothetical protein
MNYRGIIVVRGRPLFTDFVGHLQLWISTFMNMFFLLSRSIWISRLHCLLVTLSIQLWPHEPAEIWLPTKIELPCIHIQIKVISRCSLLAKTGYHSTLNIRHGCLHNLRNIMHVHKCSEDTVKTCDVRLIFKPMRMCAGWFRVDR